MYLERKISIKKISAYFLFSGDTKGIEEWLKKHYFNITNELQMDALYWATTNGESNFFKILYESMIIIIMGL